MSRQLLVDSRRVISGRHNADPPIDLIGRDGVSPSENGVNNEH